MENKKYLTEENYEKGRKKLKKIIVVILIIGFLVGGGLIFTGIIKTNTIKSDIETKESQRTETDIKKEITDIESQIESVEMEITDLNNEQIKIFQEDMGFSDRYNEISKEVTTKQNELDKLNESKSELDTELWKIQSGYNDTKNSIETSQYIPFYMIGAFVLVASCIISLALYIFLKRREITAFTAQQVMPVAQEGIEKMAPTAGNAVKEIAKGIKEGINEADDTNQKNQKN